MPKRLVDLDIPDRFSGKLPVPVSQILVAIGCTAIAVGARDLVDLVLPGAGPFALTFPSVVLATLVGRWQAGFLTQIFCALYAWYFVLPVVGSFHFTNPDDGPRVAVNMLSGFLLVAMSETFRRAVRKAVYEREMEVERRDLYLREFDHRVKNNFAIMASILDMQRRNLQAGPAADALAEAYSRIGSIARAHQSLYRGDGQPQYVDMSEYLADLCQSLREGFLEARAVDLECRVDKLWLERDRAVSIGLLANELVTNAIKHAFVGRERGRIDLSFEVGDDHMRLVIEDDGVGMPADSHSPDKLGQRLISAFVTQAGGSMMRSGQDTGTRFIVTMEKPKDA